MYSLVRLSSLVLLSFESLGFSCKPPLFDEKKKGLKRRASCFFSLNDFILFYFCLVFNILEVASPDAVVMPRTVRRAHLPFQASKLALTSFCFHRIFPLKRQVLMAEMHSTNATCTCSSESLLLSDRTLALRSSCHSSCAACRTRCLPSIQ